jgi:predicted DNA-binding protein
MARTNRSKVMSLRLPEELAEEIAAVARTDDVAVTVAIREAIADHIAKRRSAKDFKERLKKQLEEDRKALERLAE